MNGSTNPAGRLERDAKIGDLRIQLCITDITHLANRFRWLVLADRLARGQHLRHLLLKQRIVFDIAARPSLPAVAETAHAMADVEEKPSRCFLGLTQRFVDRTILCWRYLLCSRARLLVGWRLETHR